MSTLDNVTDADLVRAAAGFYANEVGRGLALRYDPHTSEVRRDGGRVRVRLAGPHGYAIAYVAVHPGRRGMRFEFFAPLTGQPIEVRDVG